MIVLGYALIVLGVAAVAWVIPPAGWERRWVREIRIWWRGWR